LMVNQKTEWRWDGPQWEGWKMQRIIYDSWKWRGGDRR
jgi:hypothetical protein